MSMKASTLVSTLKEFAAEPTTYDNRTTQWMKWNGSAWYCDCSRMIKAIGWGFSFDRTASHGGAKYLTNGVKDTTADRMIETCSEVSTDFTTLTPGECLWYSGHVGIYIGDSQAVECTQAWAADGATTSDITSTGRRSKDGTAATSWQKHGKLPWVSYDVDSEAIEEESTTEASESTEETDSEEKKSTKSKKSTNRKKAVKQEAVEDAEAVDASEIRKETESTETAKSVEAEVETVSIEAGMELILKDVPLYSSSTTAEQSGTVTGTYYLWDAKKRKNRYRITNEQENVGVSGQVTGWIDAAYVS